MCWLGRVGVIFEVTSSGVVRSKFYMSLGDGWVCLLLVIRDRVHGFRCWRNMGLLDDGRCL